MIAGGRRRRRRRGLPLDEAKAGREHRGERSGARLPRSETVLLGTEEGEQHSHLQDLGERIGDHIPCRYPCALQMAIGVYRL
eukprot:6970823-Pyramimonas_sp.AAC.1